MALTVISQDAARPSSQPPQIPDHELLRCIGSGSYGEVWLARNVMGTYRAVKVVYRANFSEDKPYEREFHGMEKFEPVSRSHDGFVDLLQVGRNDLLGYFYCVMELADDAVFGQKINPLLYQPKTLGRESAREGRLSFKETVQVGASLAAALNHLHENGLIHRDIKPSNIIFINGIPKIADIGLVVEMGESRSYVGTEGFMPPEGPGSPQADIYSLGKVLYEISTGRDRKAFPELPTDVQEISTGSDFIELNEVILRACENDVQKRYRTAEQMHRDLLLLQAGKSVKRLRLLERRMALLKKVAAAAAVLLVLVGGAIYLVSRELKIAAERRQQQIGRNIAYGTRFIDEGDFFAALPPFVEALSLDHSDPLRQETHRLRIASVLSQCPKIQDLWFLDSQINSAQISRDGRFAIVAGTDGGAVLCDLSVKNQTTIFVKDSKELEGAAFSPDGRFVVTTTEERADVWEFETRKHVRSLAAPGTIYNAQFSPNGKQLVTASGDAQVGYVWLWDLETGVRLAEIATATAAFRFASFSPDGRRLVTACETGIAQVWDIETKKPIGAPIQHQDWVYCARFSDDGKLVATANFLGVALVCDAETGRPVLPPLKHPAGVKSVEFSADGRYLVTACWDFTARVWRLSDGQAVRPFLKHSGKHVMYAAFTPDSRQVLTANANGMLSLWDLAPIGFFPGTNNFQINKSGEILAGIQTNGASLWSVETKSLLSHIQPELPVRQLMFSQNGNRVLIISGTENSGENTLQLFHTNGQPASASFKLDAAAIVASLSDDGQKFVLVNGKTAEVWSATQGKKLHSLLHPEEVKTTWCVWHGALVLTTTGLDSHLWDASSGTLLRVFRSAHPTSHAEFSPDGKLLVVCTDDDTLLERSAQIWKVATGEKAGPALEHSDGVKFATFSLDGKRVLTASEDTTARLWEVETGRLLLKLPHPSGVTQACFSPDERWIATACANDRSARVWDAESGEPVTPPLKHPFPFRQVQFANGGKSLLTRTSSGISTLWDLPRDEHPLEDLARLAQLLSGHQNDFRGGILPQRPEALRESWENLHAAQPEDFRVSRKAILGWFLRQAKASETETNWSAAALHWEQLGRLEPENAEFAKRREAAVQKRASPENK